MVQSANAVARAISIVMLLVQAASAAAASAQPEITAQGFDIAERQSGTLGAFPRLRVRFEVPNRIAELHVKERSYEVDLATTPEADHLPLFGLRRQVRQATDVTLNFQSYINNKLEASGPYEFQLEVVDRRGNSASATLLVMLEDAKQQTETTSDAADILDTTQFRAVRVGQNDVSRPAGLPLRWKTVESNRVVIKLEPDAPDDYFFPLPAEDFTNMKTRSQLAATARSAEKQSALEIPTAANRGAGRVFGLVSSETPVLLRITRSGTSLSEVGTTVVLEGEYKH